MRVLKAHVRGGRVVVDEPADLPEGTELHLVPVDEYGMTPDERAELDAALDESAAQAARGETAAPEGLGEKQGDPSVEDTKATLRALGALKGSGLRERVLEARKTPWIVE